MEKNIELEAYEIISGVSYILDCFISQSSEKVCFSDDFVKFQSCYEPNVSIKDYLQRIFKYSKCSASCLVMALIYLDRLIENCNLVLSPLNIHRLLITSVMIAAKYHDDLFYNNAFYSKIGGLSREELNHLEVEFLTKLDFKLFIEPSNFANYQDQLQKSKSPCSPYPPLPVFGFPNGISPIKGSNINLDGYFLDTNTYGSLIPSPDRSQYFELQYDQTHSPFELEPFPSTNNTSSISINRFPAALDIHRPRVMYHKFSFDSLDSIESPLVMDCDVSSPFDSFSKLDDSSYSLGGAPMFSRLQNNAAPPHDSSHEILSSQPFPQPFSYQVSNSSYMQASHPYFNYNGTKTPDQYLHSVSPFEDDSAKRSHDRIDNPFRGNLFHVPPHSTCVSSVNLDNYLGNEHIHCIDPHFHVIKANNPSLNTQTLNAPPQGVICPSSFVESTHKQPPSSYRYPKCNDYIYPPPAGIAPQIVPTDTNPQLLGTRCVFPYANHQVYGFPSNYPSLYPVPTINPQIKPYVPQNHTLSIIY